MEEHFFSKAGLCMQDICPASRKDSDDSDALEQVSSRRAGRQGRRAK